MGHSYTLCMKIITFTSDTDIKMKPELGRWFYIDSCEGDSKVQDKIHRYMSHQYERPTKSTTRLEAPENDRMAVNDNINDIIPGNNDHKPNKNSSPEDKSDPMSQDNSYDYNNDINITPGDFKYEDKSELMSQDNDIIPGNTDHNSDKNSSPEDKSYISQ